MRGVHYGGLSELSGAGSPRAALVRVFEAAGGEKEGHPRALSLLIETAEGLQHRAPEIARLVAETFLDMERRFRDAIERGQAAAEIAAHVDPGTVARVLLSLYFGLYVIAGSGTAGKPLSAVMQQVETLLPAPPAFEYAGGRGWCQDLHQPEGQLNDEARPSLLRRQDGPLIRPRSPRGLRGSGRQVG